VVLVFSIVKFVCVLYTTKRAHKSGVSFYLRFKAYLADYILGKLTRLLSFVDRSVVFNTGKTYLLMHFI